LVDNSLAVKTFQTNPIFLFQSETRVSAIRPLRRPAVGPASDCEVNTLKAQTHPTGGKKVTRWVVVEDDEGHIIPIADFSSRVDGATLDDPHATIPGLPDIRTADGNTVSRLSKGKYKVGDKIFTTRDPIAP